MVGGKGANLGLLTMAGFKVPPGFTVPTDAYVDFIERNALGPVIAKIVEQLDYGDAEQVERETGKIRQMILQAPVGDDMTAPIVEAYAGLGDLPYVAVRSSGTAEDTASASFAGL